MSEMTHEDQVVFGEKIKNLVLFVGLLKPEEVEALKKLRHDLEQQVGKTNTVAGILVDIHKADHAVGRYEAMIQRINGLLDIHESNIKLQEADEKLEKAQEGQATIDRMFGL